MTRLEVIRTVAEAWAEYPGDGAALVKHEDIRLVMERMATLEAAAAYARRNCERAMLACFHDETELASRYCADSMRELNEALEISE